MILIFTFDPLPGKTEVSIDYDNEERCDAFGVPDVMIVNRPKIVGILRAAQVVACDCFVWGIKRNHYTAFDLSTTPPTLLRRDFALDMIGDHGGGPLLPEFYFDELGNLRNVRGEMVMQGPLGNLGK